MTKREAKNHRIEMNAEQLIGYISLGQGEEVRLLSHRFREQTIINLRRFRFVRGAWSHTTSGIMLGEKAFLEVAALIKLAAEEIERTEPSHQGTRRGRAKKNEKK